MLVGRPVVKDIKSEVEAAYVLLVLGSLFIIGDIVLFFVLLGNNGFTEESSKNNITQNYMLVGMLLIVGLSIIATSLYNFKSRLYKKD